MSLLFKKEREEGTLITEGCLFDIMPKWGQGRLMERGCLCKEMLSVQLVKFFFIQSLQFSKISSI